MKLLSSRVELQVKEPRWAQQKQMQAGGALFFLEVRRRHHRGSDGGMGSSNLRRRTEHLLSRSRALLQQGQEQAELRAWHHMTSLQKRPALPPHLPATGSTAQKVPACSPQGLPYSHSMSKHPGLTMSSFSLRLSSRNSAQPVQSFLSDTLLPHSKRLNQHSGRNAGGLAPGDRPKSSDS